ncbi:FKBP-type peptidyl-prolyl cis-trans isomerase [Nisaea nitritireducens]|uniref:FKBP-type peptidyl-prolyl cis-trans isomerase n=1 Tax=Nisaea nitritireducens TaxID=568392 RepID=UPI0018695F03|nr:FKBP-type peptidyl-prolyl cis-trans isomerase [Nisaea nitritireducens]
MMKFIAVAIAAFALSWQPAQANDESPPDRLTVLDMVPGTGTTATENASVTVHYTGWLLDGTKFDSSHDRNQPFTFTLGAGRVIQGWDQGVVGMKVGGKRELVIPSKLAYGTRGAGGVIPPNAPLRFEVELISVSAPKFKAIGNDELKSLMQRGVSVLDIRRPEEWAETGTIKGVKRLTAFDRNGQFVPSFPDALGALIDKDAEVVLICRSGRRSLALARAMADQAGYAKVYNHATGMNNWIEAGNPVEK